MARITEKFIRDLGPDSIILKLLKEIELVAQFPLAPFLKGSMVVHYLMDYRARRPISKDSIDALWPLLEDFLLTKKIRKLHDTEIYWLCNEIAQMKRSGVEKIAGSTLYVFLDRYLKDEKKKKMKKLLLPGYSLP